MDKDLLREKISEAKHKEWEWLVTGILGLVLVIVAVFLMFSVSAPRYRYGFGVSGVGAMLIMIFLVLGLVIMIVGAIGGMYHSHRRSKLMKQLESLR